MRPIQVVKLWAAAVVVAAALGGRPAQASKAGHEVRAVGHKMAAGYHRTARNYHRSRARWNMRHHHPGKARLHAAKGRRSSDEGSQERQRVQIAAEESSLQKA